MLMSSKYRQAIYDSISKEECDEIEELRLAFVKADPERAKALEKHADQAAAKSDCTVM